LNYGEIGAKNEQAVIDKYKDWTLDQRLIDLTDRKSIVMHCLPVDRDHEVTGEVPDGLHSAIFDEAENRLHVQKAVLALTMAYGSN
jgi:N-acetylornithine carbamoyltransferase